MSTASRINFKPLADAASHLGLKKELEAVEEVINSEKPDNDLNIVKFTIEEVKNSVPSHMRTCITPNLVNTLNNISNDAIAAENIRNNFISYANVLKEGKFSIEEYLNAVMYVSYKLMGHTNEKAYCRTFPERYAKLVANNVAAKDIASYVSAFNKGKLVNLVLQQTIIPSWVLNQDIYQQAINTQAFLMNNALSEKVRTDAANSLLTHLTKPKETNIQLNIGEVEHAGMKEMREMLYKLADNQKKAITDGEIKTIDLAAEKLSES